MNVYMYEHSVSSETKPRAKLIGFHKKNTFTRPRNVRKLRVTSKVWSLSTNYIIAFNTGTLKRYVL